MILLLILFLIIAIITIASYLLVKVLSKREPKPSRSKGSKPIELSSGYVICEMSSTMPKSKKNTPKIGDKFNTWINPRTGTIIFYLKNKSSYDGKISEFHNKNLNKYIEEYFVDGLVIEVNPKEFKAKLYIR